MKQSRNGVILLLDSLPMTINARASGDGNPTMRCCRLCHGDTSLRSFTETYMCEGVEERYDRVLLDCFGITVYPSDCLICDHCARQLRNIDRFRILVQAAFVKQRSEYSSKPSKHSQLGIGIGEGVPLIDTNNDKTIIRPKEVMKMRMKSKTLVSKKRELNRDRRISMMSTNIPIKRLNIACIMCNQRYPMIVPFEGCKEFVCSRCKKNCAVKSDRRSSIKISSSERKDRLMLNSKADLGDQSRLRSLLKKSTQLSKVEVTSRTRQQKYQCNLCPKKYVVAQHLSHHVNTVHGSKSDKQTAMGSVYSKDIKAKESFEEHSRMHTGQPVYQCDVCLRTFKGKRSFQRHYLTHGK